jgi:hypothetical protein
MVAILNYCSRVNQTREWNANDQLVNVKEQVFLWVPESVSLIWVHQVPPFPLMCKFSWLAPAKHLSPVSKRVWIGVNWKTCGYTLMLNKSQFDVASTVFEVHGQEIRHKYYIHTSYVIN